MQVTQPDLAETDTSGNAGEASEQSKSLPISLTDRIPGELHDRIIDHLHADRSALASCSLVCHSWLRRSRHHFLPTLEIRRQNVPIIRRLLESRYATLGVSVRRLSLRLGKAVRPNRFLGETIPFVRELVLSASYSIATGELLSFTRFYAHQLTQIVLYNIHLDSFPTFAKGLHQFTRLRHLAMIGVTWTTSQHLHSLCDCTGGDATDTYTTLRPCLQSLVLRSYQWNDDIFSWIYGDVTIARLDVKTLSKRTSSDTQPDISQYYRVLGSNLQELDLHHLHDNSVIDLSPNVNLRELWFHDVVPSLGRWVIDVLGTITSPHIHRITVYLFSDDHGSRARLDDFDWSAFTNLLSDAPFIPALQTVQIVWIGWFCYDEALSSDLSKKLTGRIPGTEVLVGSVAHDDSDTAFGATIHERLFDRRGSKV